MPWNYDDEEINGIVDANLKDSPPNPPAVNTAATIRDLLKSYWGAIRGQVAGAVGIVDQELSSLSNNINLQINETLDLVETRTAAAELRAESVFETFSLKDGLGNFNAATGIATIKETAVTFTPTTESNQANGKSFSIDVPGISSITGTSIPMNVGGTLISRGTKWDYIPPTDTGYAKSLANEKALIIYKKITEFTTDQVLNGGITDLTNSKITVPNGQSGLGTTLYKSLALTKYPFLSLVGRQVRFTILVTENVAGISATRMVGSMRVNRSGSFLPDQHTSRTSEYLDATTVKVSVFYTIQAGDSIIQPNIKIVGAVNASGADMVWTIQGVYCDILNYAGETNPIYEELEDIKKSRAELDDSLTISQVDKGVDIFTNSGYVSKNTGLPVTDSGYKYSKFIPIKAAKYILAKNLNIAGAFRQASFYTAADFTTYTSSYIADDNTSVELTENNIPVTAKYVVFNTAVAKIPSLTYDKIISIAGLDDLTTVSNINSGTDVFTNSGYVSQATGLPVADVGYKYSKFIPIADSKYFLAKNLNTAGSFRQAAFYSAASFVSYVGSYTADSNTQVELNEANVPANAKYMVFNTAVAKTPVLSYTNKKYRALPPIDVNSGHWTSINASTGYSAFYGRYWNGTGWTNSDDFSGLIYAVVAGSLIHIAGNFYGGSIPVVAFFSNASLTTHIANGSQNGTSSNAYYDFKLTVPAGATHALVQQARRLDLAQPFTELVAETTDLVEKRKIILIGDSLTQMGGYADYLAKLVKSSAPQFDIFNYGIGGERTWEIAGRMGVMKMIFNPGNTFTTADSNNGKRYFELPATTATVSLGPTSIKSGWDNSSALALLLQTTPTKDTEPKYVTVNGILCLLTYSASNYFLNRVVAGSAVHRVYVGSEMLVYNLPNITSRDIVILNFGQNGGFTTNQELIDQYKVFTKNIGTDRLIVMSSHYAQTGTPSGLSYITNRDIQEALLVKEYGSKYINTREYFCGKAYLDAIDTGWWNNGTYPTDVEGELHPNAADITAMTSGLYAPMFWPNPNNGSDIIHFSRRTYQILYNKIFKRIVDLKYL